MSIPVAEMLLTGITGVLLYLLIADVRRLRRRNCLRCGEPVLSDEPQEAGTLITAEGSKPFAQHRACAVRGLIGSVAHLEKRCSCYVDGSEENDPPGLSTRQAAEAALAVWHKQEREAR